MELQNEEWRDVPGYEGLYQVSNLGRVRSLDHQVRCRIHGEGATRTQPGKILTPHIGWDGYVRFTLNRGTTRRMFMGHRLVAMAFLQNKDPKRFTQLNHKDEDKMNNRVENLEWCTPQYNSTYGENSKKKLAARMQPILVRDGRSGRVLGEYRCYKDAAKSLGIALETIYRYAKSPRPKSDLFIIEKIQK